MNIRRFSTQVLLYFFMLMLLIVTVGCSSSDDAVPGTTYSITGTVTAAAGVKINLTGPANGSTTTSSTYSFTGLPKGSYTLTPILAGYTFNPVSKVVIITGSNMNADFVATSYAGATYSISGKVTGVAVSGVKIKFTNSTSAEVLTNGDGTYTSPSLPAGGPYKVTPYNSGYAFTPASISGIMLTIANSTGNNFASESSAFTRADLEGTWEVHALETGTGTAGGWYRFTVTIDSTGTLSFNGYVDSSGGSSPVGTVVWTIDPFTGVITEGGAGGNPDYHYTMASNKNFIAGTQYYPIGTTTHPALLIAQKKVDGTVYKNADDLWNKNFVFHQLNVGSSNKWQYGAGSISGTGAVNITINNDAVTGTSNPGDTGSIISVDSNGVVTMTGTGAATYHGFLSDDKRTIVGTVTEGTEYHMMIIQIINGECNCYTSNIAGISYGHVLATGAAPAPFWVDQKISITGGAMSFINWESSNPAVTAPAGTKNISVSSSKTATITGSDFNGQLSYDEKFMVGTETFSTGVFALDVFTY